MLSDVIYGFRYFFGIILGMKVKTSITLESTLIEQIEKVRFESESRSTFFSEAIIQLIAQRERAKRDAADTCILATVGSELNVEANRNLAFVTDVFDNFGVEQS